LSKNYIQNKGLSQGGGGGRQTALLPQKTRKIYSYNQLKKALSEGLRNPAAVPVNRFEFFAKKDGQLEPVQAEPVGAFSGADPRTIEFYLELALRNNWAVLDQGVILINKEIAEKLRENRRIAKGDWEKIAQLDLRTYFGPNAKVVRLAYRVLIDIDKKDEVAIRKLVKYLRKLKVYPEVWETQKGYHLYVYFYDRKEEIIVIDKDGKQKVFVGFILPRADDNRIKDVEECLKVLCAKLGIKPDIVSATHAVWLEGFPNPLKDGFATKLLFKGFPLPLQDVWQKLLNVNPAKVFKKVRQNKIRYYRKRKPNNTDKEEEAHRELDDLLLREHSNVFFALSQHGTLKACKKLWDAGYELDDIENELKDRLEIRTKADEKALQKFLAYFEKNYTTPTRKQESPPKEEEHKEKERKHEHYWELALRVIEAWEKGYQKISHIAKYLRVPRTNIYNLRSFLKKHGYEWEDLFTKSEEVLAFLKAHAKGGNKWKRKKEWDREAWLEEFQRLKPEYIRLRKEEAKARRAKKRLAPVLFLPAGSVYIGNIQVYSFPLVVGWSSRTNRPPRTSKKQTKSSSPQAGRQQRFTPAVPLVILSRDYSTQLRDALYEVLQRYHSEDGLPVVLVVPSRFSDTGSTSLKLTPYKVPPRNFRQLWQEIREKFGKTVQGLSTRNGALDWFLKVWEQVKDKTTLVSVPSTPFPIKKEKPSVLSYLLSAKQLLAKQTEPPEKKDEKKDNHYGKAVLSRAEIAELIRLFQAHPDKKISELLPYMPERARRVLKQVKRELKQELDHLSELKAKGELPPLLQKIEGFVRFWVARFPVLFDPPVVFRRLFDAILRNYEKIYGPDPVFLELRRVGSFAEFMTKTVYLQEQLRALETPRSKGEPKKLKLPPSKVIEDVVRFLEGRRSQISRQELETTIYAAWRKVDKDEADRLAVSRCIDRYEGVLWKKLNNGHYALLVSSDKVRVRIRNYVLELKQAKKNGQGQTSADGNGSLGSQHFTHNGNNGNGKPSANGDGSLGSTSLPTNGNGKYDIDQIIHTLQKEGKVYVPPQFVHEIVRELRRRGFSVNYWSATGLIELAGEDDELPF
jgi:vacuolar-type H+-ATPase subunit F/Vma7